MTDVYGVPNSRKGLCIRGVHRILKQLRSWYDELPSDLRVKERNTPRPVASLHLAYNQCIIQTTRPVLLHLFKRQFQLGRPSHGNQGHERAPAPQDQQSFSPITLALAESCVNAARSSSRIVEGLFLDGAIASYGYWDAHHIFSAALILVISAVMRPAAATSDALETLLSILRSIKKDGNIPAIDFCDRLSQVQARVFSLRAKMQGQSGTSGAQVIGQQLQQQQQTNLASHDRVPNHSTPNLSDTMAAASSLSSLSSSSFVNTPSRTRQQMGSISNSVDNMDTTQLYAIANNESTSVDWSSTANDVLGDPLIGSFLDEAPRMPWLGSEGGDLFFSDSGSSGTGGVLGQFASEMDAHFSF